MEERTYKVYKLTFPNGMIYIGQTKHPIEHRIKTGGYQHNEKMLNAIKTFNDCDIQKEILADKLTQSEAYAVEKRMIAEYDSCNPAVGYNISKGGKETFLGLKHTEETRRKMSASSTGKVFTEEHKKNISKALKASPNNRGVNNPMYGKPKSVETIQKQYASHRHEMKPVIQMTLNGETINCFDSVHQASKATGVDRTSITRSAKGLDKHPTRFIWEYAKGGV